MCGAKVIGYRQLKVVRKHVWYISISIFNHMRVKNLLNKQNTNVWFVAGNHRSSIRHSSISNDLISSAKERHLNSLSFFDHQITPTCNGNGAEAAWDRNQAATSDTGRMHLVTQCGPERSIRKFHTRSFSLFCDQKLSLIFLYSSVFAPQRALGIYQACGSISFRSDWI
jgi:hypothetical protein